MNIRVEKPTTIEQFRLKNIFDGLRDKLQDDDFAAARELPLAYWALPTDRRLPLILLGRTLGELITTSFDELANTPGIGQKKIASLLKLLERAATTELKEESPVEVKDSYQRPAELQSLYVNGEFDSGRVSEAMWGEWRQSIRSHSVRYEQLGRVAPTLQSLPSVIWKRALNFYVDRPLAEIRQLKTHGEKRVAAVLEVFANVHYAFAALQQAVGAGMAPHRLTVQFIPAFVEPIELWIGSILDGGSLSAEDLRQKLGIPLVEQIGIDLGTSVASLVADRIGLNGTPKSVRSQAHQLAVTRARVYQMLEDCGKVMEVRWPEGESLLNLIESKLQSQPSEDALEAFYAIRDLFFPRTLAPVGPQLPELELEGQPEPVLAF